ncbi:EAL domain-containing protein [Sulfurimonas sp.]|uniref:EAL domain-containing protein n=1 Tax=Sulfurimonas sp. TaxID=2022749 RepID=UPI002B48AD6C|nr:EAL domain-containing protein [Sulfurimonas sp.]
MEDTSLLKTIKLLYVEDDDDIRESTLEILKLYFENIVVAKDGFEALGLYDSSIDLVISDIVMPNMNGVEMSKKIKIIKPNQPIILLAEHKTEDFLIEAIDAGVDKFIIKPILSINKFISSILELSKKIKSLQNYNEKVFFLKQKSKIIDENVFMTVTDLDGKILEISSAYLNFTGFLLDEVIGSTHKLFRRENADKELIKNLWETILENKKWTGQLKNNKYSGEEYWLKQIILPLFDMNNEKIGYTTISRNITNSTKLKELSITDALTNIHNRRYFDYSLKREFKSSSWRKENFALLIIDVDYFKDYNDSYGHPQGDKVLKRIASQMKNCINYSVNDVFRIGGEEFAIFVSDSNDEDVIKVSSEIVKNVESLKIKHEKSKVSDYVTISIGAVNVNGFNNTMSSDDIYNLADDNLYKAKKAGRNRVVFNENIENINLFKDLDIVTKLPNRQSLIQDLELLQEETMLILLHVNQINIIKDLYGIDIVSNMILKKAQQLNEIIIDDNVTLYSLNMYEFAILISSKKIFEKYLALLKYTILINHEENICLDSEQELVSDFTAGVAYGIIDLFNKADISLQDAVMNKKSLVIYNKNQTTIEFQKSTIDRMRAYKKALHSDNIIPYFQPIIDAKDNSVLKYEALARIVTESEEVILPCYFLDSAKQDNTFEFFTRQMMQKVFAIYANNKADLSINVTYENIISPTMIEYIKNRLDKYGGEGITFEIVESEDIEDYQLVEEFILMIKEYGCKVSLDDFGSGYSNFTHIVKLNIDYIKLDGSLIEKLLVDKTVEYMVNAVIVFAKNAKIKIIAEFVSTKELDAKVREMGVDYIQGYYYGEPKTPQSYSLI